jgi:hypothetical protein
MYARSDALELAGARRCDSAPRQRELDARRTGVEDEDRVSQRHDNERRSSENHVDSTIWPIAQVALLDGPDTIYTSQ